MRQAGWRLVVKKTFDRSVAATLLGLCAPLLCVAAAALYVEQGRPILFRQQRPGRCAKPFTLRKFRTMRDVRAPDGTPLPDAARLTRVGRLLRASSIDELPQLWNVLAGEMSLVGPRPLLMRYLPRYTQAQARRHDVLPGMTGWAQVQGRNAIDWTAKLALDQWYVENWSLALDIKILLATFGAVLRRDGIARPGHATMPEFYGEGEAR